jgi:hypothetical protein
VTLNMGLRWDPFQGAVWENGTITNFSLDNFYNGVKSRMFPNAPPGLLFPGDPGFPPGKTGFNKQWLNLSPRAGVAWDVKGDARTAVRASYALSYDYPGQSFLQAAANVAPFNNRTNLSGNIPMDDPYSIVPGGPPLLPTPIPPPVDAVFPLFSSYTSMDPDINSIRVHSWNATIEQQIGADWQVAASYLGGYMDRIWGRKNLNPGVYLGPSSTAANIQSRRVFTLANPAVGQYYSDVYAITAIGVQNYRGLKLSVRRRAASGLSFNANYTISHCETDSPYNGLFISQFEYTDPNNPSYDTGNCPFNRTHVGNATVGYQTPQFASRVLRVVASDWRVSGIFTASSGAWFTVITGRDTALNGQAGAQGQEAGQRVNQVSDDVYGAKTLESYLNRAAFAEPAPGEFGNHVRNSIAGPGQWNIDLALSRLLTIAASKTLELRIEAFNLTNHFNWGTPQRNFLAGTFGRITTQATPPRIMQFGVKYGF